MQNITTEVAHVKDCCRLMMNIGRHACDSLKGVQLCNPSLASDLDNCPDHPVELSQGGLSISLVVRPGSNGRSYK